MSQVRFVIRKIDNGDGTEREEKVLQQSRPCYDGNTGNPIGFIWEDVPIAIEY